MATTYLTVRDHTTRVQRYAVTRPGGMVDCRDQHGHTLITFTSAQKAWAWLCAEASRQPGWLPPRAERPHNGRRSQP